MEQQGGRKRKKRRTECLLLEEVHEAKLEEFRRRREEILPHIRDQVVHLHQVLRDEAPLTDALVNAVFKNHELVKNARQKEQELEDQDGEDDEPAPPLRRHYVGAPFTIRAVSAKEQRKNLLKKAKEHINYLRRLKGKSAKKLTREEIGRIQDWLVEKERWCKGIESDQEFFDYLAISTPILLDYQVELDRVNQQLREQEQAMARAEELKKQQKQEKKRIRKKQKVEEERETASTGGGIKALFEKRQTELVPVVMQKELIQASSSGGNGGSKKLVDQSILDYIPPSDTFGGLKEIYQRYMQAMGQASYNTARTMLVTAGKICLECGVERIVDRREATATCPRCQHCLEVQQWDSFQSVSYDNPVTVQKGGNSYERISHFEQWIKRIQAENRKKIPAEVYTAVYDEAKRLGWKIVTKSSVRMILWRLGLTKHYENDVAIAMELNDVPAPDLTEEEDKTLRQMFIQAQPIFDACPMEIKQRNNYISYPYHNYQCCLMLGWDHLLKSFPLLKGEDNRRQHDRIWEWMCNHATDPGWTFYPTI